MSSREVRENAPYYLGLDIGTESIGWAVTDRDYNILKFNGKAMWGVRLFDEASTAAERRLFRVSRRRTERRVQRLALLQDLFADAVSAVDPGFFTRLNESALYHDDKSMDQRNTLFADADYDDKKYHAQYPTIYHLRKALIDSAEPFDVRLVYLAIHHIIKYRGHFLFEGDMKTANSLEEIMNGFSDEVQDELDVSFACSSVEEMQKILLNEKMRMSQKQKELGTLFGASSSVQKAMIKLLTGAQASVADIFTDVSEDELKALELPKLEFRSGKYEENEGKLEALLGERFYILQKLKAVYDWALLSTTLKGNEYLSYAKADVYDRHKEDLRILKKVIRKYASGSYDAVFKSPTEKNNYCAYVGMAKKNKKKIVVQAKCLQEDLCKYLSGVLKDAKAEDDPDLTYIKEQLDLHTLLPKIVSKNNGVIPHQVHEHELEVILRNAEKYLPFLTEKDENGLTASEKILQIFRFRIPYYVGPLNDRNPNARNRWVVRRSHEKIYPWNFDKIVDVEQSASEFITRMTAQCTYLHGEKVLAANAVTYCRFSVLNQLNNLKIQGDPISVQMKQDIFNDLFLKHAKVTVKQLLGWLKAHGHTVEKEDLSGFDTEKGFTSGMRPYIEMKSILGDAYTDAIADEAVRICTVFGDDRKMLRSRMKAAFGKVLNEEQIAALSAKRYSGWGRMSYKFLNGFIAPIPELQGRELTILQAMWETNNNLMQLLSGSYLYEDAVRRYNSENGDEDKLTYASVRDLYVSPSVKRQIWQVVSVVEELCKIMKHDPEKTFIEMARSKEEKKRTESRKDKLLELYKNCKDDERDWVGEIEARDESEFRRDKLYLYYTQKGRCIYTWEKIDINDLYNNNVWDIDHIYPQSKTKDDSLDNRVLSKREINAEKSDVYPLPEDIRIKQHAYWTDLYEHGLISKEKYTRLTRCTPFDEKELAGFINRQLVETRQSTKAVADILKGALKETEIVYVKAGLVSDFRQDFDMLKCREVNDLHHAKDAYLNIVVGNVYNTKFTHDPRNFFREQNVRYSLNCMYDHDVARGGVTAWIAPKKNGREVIPGKEGTIQQVRNVMRRNNILVTRLTFERHGALFDLQPVKKGNGQLSLHGQPDSPYTSIERYGGYNKIAGSYYMVVAYTEKGKEERDIVDVPLYLVPKLRNDEDAMMAYLRSVGYKDPRIVIPEFKVQSLLEINGFRMRITGRTGDQYVYAPSTQLVLGYEDEKYIRCVVKYNQRATEYAKEHKGAVLLCRPEYDGISQEGNVRLYDIFRDKLSMPCYKGFLNAGLENMNKGREKFLRLSCEEQSMVLEQSLHFFACNRTVANLKALDLSASCGIVSSNKRISKYETVRIIHLSITGLFEQEVDLLK